ncbi:MAG: hypothetical protein EA427_00210, partial [Spirochaetaceae bacterium]
PLAEVLGTGVTIAVPRRRLPRRESSWSVPSGLIRVPDRPFSPSSLDSLCNHPHQYVLRRVAGLKRSSVGRLPEGPLLYGTVAHSLVERYLAERTAESTRETVPAWLEERYEQTIRERALLLLQPGNERFLHEVRTVVSTTLQWLEEEISRRNPERVESEQTYDSSLGPYAVSGRIDIALRGCNPPVVVDIKWSGSSFRRKTIEEGREIQLPVYALLLGHGDGDLDLCYYIATGGTVITWRNSRFSGAAHVPAHESSREYVPLALTRIESTIRERLRQFSDGVVALPGVELPHGERTPTDTTIIQPAAELSPYDETLTLLGWTDDYR